MNDNAFTVRRAAARDMAFVAELWKKLAEEMAACDERYALRPDAEILWAKWAGQRLRDQSSVMLIAEAGDEYVGYLLAHVDEAQPIFSMRKHAIFTDVFVLPDHRKKGIAKKLVEEAFEFFKGLGVTDLRANLLAKNASAREFLTKMGFGEFLYKMWRTL